MREGKTPLQILPIQNTKITQNIVNTTRFTLAILVKIDPHLLQASLIKDSTGAIIFSRF